MFKLVKCIFILSLSFITESLGLNPNVQWNVENNKISFITNIENKNNTEWWYSFNMLNNNYTGDSVVLWKENNVYNFDSFTYTGNDFIRKDTKYILNKNICVQKDTIRIEFTRFLDTKSNTDVQLCTCDDLLVSFTDSLKKFPEEGKHTVYTLLKFNEKIDRNTGGDRIEKFYSTFITLGFFLSISTISFILKYTNCFPLLERHINILGYKTLGSVIFLSAFTLWWIIMLVFSFLSKSVGEVLFKQGVWIMMIMSFILMPITRNSVWTALFKVSNKDINFIHKYMSISCIIASLVKFSVVLAKFKPTFLIVLINENTGGSPLAGTIATFCLILLGIFSVPFIKKTNYELFYYVHRILSIGVIIASACHYLISLYYLIPPLILYVTDLILRYIYINKGIYAKLKTIGDETKDTSCIIMNVKIKKHIDSPPGCYYLICIRNISSFQWHPFSLVKHHNKNLTFCAKNMGVDTWTGKLKKLTDVPNNDMINKDIYLQGPYTYFDMQYLLKKYKNMIIIAGGVGVTPIFSILNYLDELMFLKKININVLFVWIVKNTVLIDHFKQIINDFLHNKKINIHVYITEKNINYSCEGGYIRLFKPTIDKVINQYMITKGLDAKDTCILGSGPERLLNNIKDVSLYLDIDNFCEEF